MKLTKKFISILASSLCLFSNVFAIRSSISMPEDMSSYAYSEEKDAKDSPYELVRMCDRIVIESPHVPIDKTIRDTTCACTKAYRRMANFLNNGDVPSDCFYVAGLSNYKEVIECINYIIFEIILTKSEQTKHDFTPSSETIINLNLAIWMTSAVIEKYEAIFHAELWRPFAPDSTTKQLDMLMNKTAEGLWRIAQFNSFA